MSSLKPPDSARKPHNEGAATEDSRRGNHTSKASPVKSDHSGSNRSLEKIDEAEEAALDRPEGSSNSMDDNSGQPSSQQQQQQQQQRPPKQKPGKKGARGKHVPPDEDSAENSGDKANNGSGNSTSSQKNNAADVTAASSKAHKTSPPDSNNSVNATQGPAASPTSTYNTNAAPNTTTTTNANTTSPKAKRDTAAWSGAAKPLSPTATAQHHHHNNNNTSGPYTQTLPGRPPPLPAVNSGGSQTVRASHPAPTTTTTKPPGINQAARGSLTSRPAWDSPHANSLSPTRGGDAFTMSAEEWRVKADVPSWRKITPVGSSDSIGGAGGGAGDAGDAANGHPQGQGPDHGGGGSRRSTISSRDDGLSYAGDEDDVHGTPGRKFTKKMPNKDKFGSSTTLSSATETSDDNGDGNFHVVMRVRPLSTQEKQRRDQFVVNFPGDGQCSVDSNGSNRNFQFNVVFEPDAAQEDVFENCGIKRLVDNAVSGYTCTAFAFGQTGSGKTHTMTGPPSQYHQVGVSPDPNMYGIIQRSFKYMYQQIKQQGGGKVIRASYLEIYNEQVIDLLNNSHRRYLSVRWSKNKGFYVENLFTVECDALDDLMAVLEEGEFHHVPGDGGQGEGTANFLSASFFVFLPVA